jgi:hypothetical protein
LNVASNVPSSPIVLKSSSGTGYEREDPENLIFPINDIYGRSTSQASRSFLPAITAQQGARHRSLWPIRLGSTEIISMTDENAKRKRAPGQLWQWVRQRLGGVVGFPDQSSFALELEALLVEQTDQAYAGRWITGDVFRTARRTILATCLEAAGPNHALLLDVG